MEESLIMEIWDTFREYIPEKNRELAATQYVDFLLDKDISIDVIEGFLGYDPHLDDAIKTVIDEEGDYDEDEVDYEDEEDY